jgi:hypothetical protein
LEKSSPAGTVGSTGQRQFINATILYIW